MERIRNLPLYSKILLLALVVMTIVFAVVYPVVTSREGMLYNDHIFVPGTENGNTIYSAKVDDQLCYFTVTPDKTVTFRCGEKVYGPYTAKEDPTAIPKEDNMAHLMTGLEVREGDEILFRGGIYTGSIWLMVNEDGTPANFGVIATMSDGTMTDGKGNIIDPMEPSVSKILKIMDGPELTHKGIGGFWFVGLFVALWAAVGILFADELFRLQFLFSTRYPEDIEPSDLVLALRPIGQTIMVLATLGVYTIGLQ